MQPSWDDLTDAELDFAMGKIREQAAPYLEASNRYTNSNTEEGNTNEVTDTHDYSREEANYIRVVDATGPLPKAHRTYPWHRWVDGKIHRAVRNRDFDMAPGQFRAYLHNRAHRTGKFLWSRVQFDVVDFAFFNTEDERYDATHRRRIQDEF